MELIQQNSQNRDTHTHHQHPGTGLSHCCSLCDLLTLVFQLEARLVLRVVAVEVHGGFVRRRQEGARDFGAAEAPDDVTGVVRPVADFDKVMVWLGGEVQELDVSTWEEE